MIKIKNLDEKIYDIKRLIMCFEYLTMKLEELKDAKKMQDKEGIKEILEDIEDYIGGLDFNNVTLLWIKEVNTTWVKGGNND